MSAVTGRARPKGILDRLVGRRRGRDDRGAVAVTVAILFSSGVLLGMLALVVDVGQIYVERTGLQSSADAAALAVAKACSTRGPDCASESSMQALAARYANDNASDGVTHVAQVCGRAGGLLPACPASATNLSACLGVAPAEPVPFVEVRVSTEIPGNRFVLPPAFAQAMAGNQGYQGTSVGACARAAWSPKDITIIAMTISTCEFAKGRGSAPYPNEPTASREYVIEFWEGAFGQCSSADYPPPAGWDPAGPAGFLNGGGNDCSITMSPDGEVTGTFFQFFPYEIAPESCEKRIRAARKTGEVIYLPVYDGQQGTAENPRFHHTLVAPFVVTGFQFGAPPKAHPKDYNGEDHREPSTLTGEQPCDEIKHRCMSGVFIGQPIPIADLLGTSFVRLIG